MPPSESSDNWFETLRQSMSPAQRRNMDRRMKVTKLEMRFLRLVPWMTGPLLGLVTVFWVSLVEEGPRIVFHKWGPLGFSYLNDGMKPSLWHTYQQVMHPRGPYNAIYVSKRGAPRNKREADEGR